MKGRTFKLCHGRYFAWIRHCKSVLDYRFSSNKHTHMFPFVTKAF